MVGVFTHPDDPREVRWFRSVAERAQAAGLPFLTPDRLPPPEWLPRFQEEFRPDLIFSFYYRRMISTTLLNTARLGAFNMHGSLLPKYRGKAPVNWAVLRGETRTGATLHHMVQEPDAGDIVDQEAVSIGPRDRAIEVMDRVTAAAVTVLDRQLNALLNGTAPRHPQNHAESTYFGGRRPEDGRIDWDQPTTDIFNLIRAVTHPYPGAFADVTGVGQLRIWWAEPTNACGAPGEVLSREPLIIATRDSALRLTEFEPIPS
ncbi:MAG: hypothetical protein OHK005_01790 [Candidatus Methylacidiphilales bacterium]